MKLDISSLASVREFCAEFKKKESRLDILVNNAGIAGMRRTVTDEGLELHMVTNHLGPFLLTNILLSKFPPYCFTRARFARVRSFVSLSILFNS